MEKGVKRKVEWAFRNYKKLLNSCVISTVEWAESNFAVNYEKVNVKSSFENKKEEKLCEIIDKSHDAIRWCYVVEKVLDHYRFEQDKITIIETYYFNNKSDICTCIKAGICRRTFYYWINEILDIAYRWAIEFKLIKEK